MRVHLRRTCNFFLNTSARKESIFLYSLDMFLFLYPPRNVYLRAGWRKLKTTQTNMLGKAYMELLLVFKGRSHKIVNR
jgi:hypothetical protein